MPVEETASLWGESVWGAHRILEHKQAHSLGESAPGQQVEGRQLWEVGYVTESRVRAEQVALFPLRPFPYAQHHNAVKQVDPLGETKTCVFVLTCLNFSHLQSTLHPMQYTPRDFLATAQNSFELMILMPFNASALFCFISSTLANHFPLRTFFIWGNEKNVTRGEIRWAGRVGNGVHAGFLSKTAGHSAQSEQVHLWITHHDMGKHVESSKKFTAAQGSLSQQQQLVHWYRWAPRTLT